MAINTNHTVEVLDGKECSIIEKGISSQRAQHIVDILLCNGFEVIAVNEDGLVKVGVTDILFNPVMAVYNRYLRTKEGKVVTPALWYHNDSAYRDFYWLYR